MKKEKIFEITKNIFAGIGILLSLVVLAGIYKFNFTNDDISIETESGEIVSYDEYNESMKKNTKLKKRGVQNTIKGCMVKKNADASAYYLMME